jgi:hypothetical protein
LGAGACLHCSAYKCALERLPVRTVRHTVASHDMHHADLCEAPDNMLVNNVALELLAHLRKMSSCRCACGLGEKGDIYKYY